MTYFELIFVYDEIRWHLFFFFFWWQTPCQATLHGVIKSLTEQKQLIMHTPFCIWIYSRTQLSNWTELNLHSSSFICWKDYPWYNFVDSYIGHQMTISAWVLFCIFYSFLLIYVFIFLGLTQCLDYCSFISNFTIR